MNLNISNKKVKLATTSVVALMLLLITNVNQVVAQSGTYEIKDESGVENISSYESAMNNAKFDAYRFVGKRRTLTFVSGVKIELLSANEVLSKGLTIDKSKAMDDTYVIKNAPVFKLLPNGHIKANYTSQEKSALK